MNILGTQVPFPAKLGTEADIKKTFGPDADPIKLVMAANKFIESLPTNRELDFCVDGGVDCQLSIIIRTKTIETKHFLHVSDDEHDWKYKNVGTREMCRINGKAFYFGEIW